MIVFNNYFFLGAYYNMSEIPLNKFEKEKRVIELHLAGKTIREISKEVRMSFRDISKLIKAYEKKIILQTKKEEQENNQQKVTTTKKLSLSSRAFNYLQRRETN